MRVLLLLSSWLALSECTKNNRVLFLAVAEAGQLNPQIATALSLAENHHSIDVHMSSFPAAKKKVEEASAKLSQEAKKITFHQLNAPGFEESVSKLLPDLASVAHTPGLWGMFKATSKMDMVIMPWTENGYETAYKEVNRVIEELDPEILVVDAVCAPALDAALVSGRRMMILIAGSLEMTFAGVSPIRALFRAPVFSSGGSWPIPLWNIPGNILMALRLAYVTLGSPNIRETKAKLQAKGMAKGVGLLNIHEAPWPFIVNSKQFLEYPIYVPPNVTETGPILMPFKSIQEQDAGLANWLSKPTILVNLGSHTTYTEESAKVIISALNPFLESGSVQVLWKFNQDHSHQFSDAWLEPYSAHLKSGALRFESWIKADIPALLDTGHVVAFIHHAGQNSFNEALVFGVPQIALPMWFDCYDIASRMEWLGIGIWASRTSAPKYNTMELGNAIKVVLDRTGSGKVIFEKAQRLAAQLADQPLGRDVAALAVKNWVEGRPQDPWRGYGKEEL